jgi:hypothetical protein
MLHKIFTFASILIVLCNGHIFAQPEYYEMTNLKLIKQYQPDESVFGVDVYNNYVFLHERYHTEILDISNVNEPLKVNYLDQRFLLKILNNYGYAFTDNEMIVYNLDLLPSLEPITYLDLTYGNACIGDNFLFHYSSSTLNVISVENPTNPEIKGSLELPTRINGATYVDSGLVHLGCDDGLRIVDVMNVSKPETVSFITSLGAPLAESILLNDHLIINQVFSQRILIVDIQDPFNPKEIWYFNYSGSGFVNYLHAQDNYIFATGIEKNSYLNMFDFHDRSSHNYIGYFANRLRGSGRGITSDERYIYYAGLENGDGPPYNVNGGLFILQNELLSSLENGPSLIDEYHLSQNYPNPFNPSTSIKYSILKKSNVAIQVFDVLGSEIVMLVNKQQTYGNYTVEFDGSELTSGIYFYRMRAGEFVQTKKMLLMK